MARRIDVECEDGHQEELVLGSDEAITKCECGKDREIVWTNGSAGFRVKGLTKRF